MIERIKLFFMVCAIESSAYFLLPYAPRNEVYFAVAGAFASLYILFLIEYFDLSALPLDLMLLSVLQIIVQIVGLIGYEIRLSPKIYIWGAHSVVAATFLRLLIVGRYGGNSTRDRRWNLSNIFAIMGRQQDQKVPV